MQTDVVQYVAVATLYTEGEKKATDCFRKQWEDVLNTSCLYCSRSTLTVVFKVFNQGTGYWYASAK